MKNETIKRSYAIEAIKSLHNILGDAGTKAAVMALGGIQAVDDVSVVRCKDCRYCIDMLCYAQNLIKENLYVPPLHMTRKDDFCSYGERRGERKE